jgi:hypothetical protein
MFPRRRCSSRAGRFNSTIYPAGHHLLSAKSVDLEIVWAMGAIERDNHGLSAESTNSATETKTSVRVPAQCDTVVIGGTALSPIDPRTYHPQPPLSSRAITRPPQEKIMKLIRAVFLTLAVLLPTSWTIAHAADGMNDGAGGSGDMKKGKAKKSKKKSGDMGDKKGDMGDKKSGM